MPPGLAEAVMADLNAAPVVDASPLEGIISRVLGGETEAFEELVLLTESQILGLSWKILRDRDLARDAAQETYLRIYRALEGYRPGEGFQAWMYRITLNVCFDLARKRGPLMAPESVLESEAHAHPATAEEAVLLTQRRALVRQALDTLTPAERSAIVLCDLEGCSTEDVARTLGVKAVTVRTQVSSARSKLQAFCSRLVRRTNGGLP
jgi:RNA polymerase sigma-70 factor, ECF subfamily